MELNRNERKAARGYFFKGLAVIIPCLLVMWVLLSTCGMVNEATQVAKEEFGPRAMLTKYEWFKDAAASLDKKVADIKVYQSRIDSMKADYGNTPRKEWDRTDKEQMSVWQAEVAGVIASFNGLAAEYNAQMAKFNWRFANAGDLPAGATEPLPREFKTYK